MKSSDTIEAALAAGSAEEMRALLCAPRGAFTLIEINRLTRRLVELGSGAAALKIGILRTYATELLAPYWKFEALLSGLRAEVYQAPYGIVYAEAGTEIGAVQPDVTYFMLQWEDLDARLKECVSALDGAGREEALAGMTGRLRGMLESFRKVSAGLGVVTILPRMMGRELGLFDAMAVESEASFSQEAKRRIAAEIRERFPAITFCDLDVMMEEVGRANMFDQRLWQTSHAPFSAPASQFVVRQLMAYPLLLKRPRAKVIVLDADNTLWGGIVGEDGPTGIALGPDYPGTGFVAFQRRLLAYQQRGILLALCSRNNHADVMEILRNHPHQILREGHFAAMRVNWEPKVENLKSLAGELNLGLESFVFVDDSEHECFQVRAQLPQVMVVRTPARAEEIADCLENVASLEILSLTQEDRKRTSMYVQERQRQQLAQGAVDVGQYLQSLKMVMTVAFDAPEHLARIAQLTQKTNQFNLTTKRYLESDIQRMMNDPDWLVADFSLADVLGESGIVGVALVRGMKGPAPEIDAFLMSCRVIGRGAETAFLETVLEACRRGGASRVRASYIATAKNSLVADFLGRHGFGETGGGNFERDLAEFVPTTGAIRIQMNG